MGYQDFFPEFSGVTLSDAVLSVLAAFYRGIYIESMARDPAYIEEVRTVFQDMLVAHLTTDRKAA